MSELLRYISIPPLRIVGMVAFVAVMLSFIIWVNGMKKKNPQMIQSRKYFFIISAILLVLSIGALVVQKPQWGLDFTGGTVIHLAVEPDVEANQIREAITGFAETTENPDKFTDPRVQLSLEVTERGQNDKPQVKTAPEPVPADQSTESSKNETTETLTGEALTESGETTASAAAAAVAETTSAEKPVETTPAVAGSTGTGAFRQAIIQVKEIPTEQSNALVEHLGTVIGSVEIMKIETIGPTIGGELREKALLALIIALLAQLIYITFRFGTQFRYGLAADIALVHDLIIMVGFYTLFRKPIDSAFVAALLTIIGYSVMDSVVVFDRVRENLKLMKGRSYEEIVNMSLNQVVTRTASTSFTTIMTVFAIYYFGGATLQNFAFALLVGMISGTYSSLFIAAPLIVIFDNYSKSKQQKRVEERRTQLEAEAETKRKKKAETAAKPEVVVETDTEPEEELVQAAAGGNKSGRKRRR
jgi:preprotein translocase subunit SecF